MPIPGMQPQHPGCSRSTWAQTRLDGRAGLAPGARRGNAAKFNQTLAGVVLSRMRHRRPGPEPGARQASSHMHPGASPSA